MSLAVIDFDGILWTCGRNVFGELSLGDYKKKEFF